MTRAAGGPEEGPSQIPRTPRRPDEPTISVVVASNRERALLDACLASLMPQCSRAAAQLIVARSGSLAELNDLRAAYPGVTFVAAPPDATIPQLRASGMSETSGDIVALTEDHCVADDAWLETLRRTAKGPADVVGGGMGNAQRQRATDWAAYFAEYGFYAETRSDSRGERGPLLLTAANVAYSRRVLPEVVACASNGSWENVAHDRLRATGSMLEFTHSAVVYQNKNYGFFQFCVERFEHGRDFARARLIEEGSGRRISLLYRVPFLPPLLTWRVARSAAPSRWLTFLRVLPLTFAFLTAWSIGEAAGYLTEATGSREATA
jgi:hypothetical protein